MDPEKLEKFFQGTGAHLVMILAGVLLATTSGSTTALIPICLGGTLFIFGTSWLVQNILRKLGCTGGISDWGYTMIPLYILLFHTPLAAGESMGSVLGFILIVEGLYKLRVRGQRLLSLPLVAMGLVLSAAPGIHARNVIGICGGILSLISVISILIRRAKRRREKDAAPTVTDPAP